MRDDTKNGCVADFDVDNDVCDASFVHYEALFRVGWGKGYVCPWSEFQIGLFHVLKNVAVVTPYLTHLYVICRLFILSYVTGSSPCHLSEFYPNMASYIHVLLRTKDLICIPVLILYGP